MAFPETRLRRLRKNQNLRDMLTSTIITVNDFVYPMFVIYGKNKEIEISSMPGVYQYSLDKLVGAVENVVKLGIRSVLLFGIPEQKDSVGTGAYIETGIVQQAVRLLKKEFPDLIIVTDVCLCEYTSHGHCGLIENGNVLNDQTLDLLAKTALSHAEAGADIVAPSDMMDGRVGAIRKELDLKGYENTILMAYSAKYASSFYGPFREAADSTPQFGDRKTYQMDPRGSINEAVLETKLDILEGADIVMVKPAMAYMDIIRKMKDEFLTPIASYNVSGEYSMIKAASQNGWIDEKSVVLELMTGLKRAGSDIILTYHAASIAKWLQEV
ncbi:porphobilinogen synthase [Desulfonispora thiosulfatigenes DSM 11270]|uniref:Delta-aminolevulinic acid dehydratase n=1 Tax=Desulfonispora thiosulfatigenes DSM 11270 TaxID=656914 RepID=A0A1W1VLI2_DESTI|nr:porphobilinogen synthase [Desulfonispora thiosulfatigenes]SMB94188.1 porphobilinogen synthase [Desulfonispora thiosulfatigenes DSM 11270]